MSTVMAMIHAVSVKAKWTLWIITMNSHIIVANKIIQMRNLSSPLVFAVTPPLPNSVNVLTYILLSLSVSR